ncbi:MAG: flagellar basal body-associated FliL family protein [Nitrospirae bacterium]|nr:MAG: flagellar basal body-associated FliL family protein [Nitrospirota bacterium]
MREQSSDGQEADESDLQWRRLLAVGVVLGLFAAGIVLAYNLSPVPFLKGGFSLSTSYNNSVNRPTGPSNNLFYMEPLIVNSRDIDATDFVRLTLTLELERPDVADDVQARLAAIENVVIITAASQDSKILRSVEGKTRLRDGLTRKINALLPNGGVRSVYFADFIIR